jgi:hypothetical protein
VRPLTERLILNPVWRDPYFTDQIALPPAAAHARALLLAGLIPTAAPPARDEVVAVVKRLNSDGLGQEARNLWFVANRIPQTGLYDGRFEHTQTAQAAPYEWLLKSMPGTTVEAVARPGTPGLALHVTSDGMSSGVLAQQSVQLIPGRHHLAVGVNGAPTALASFSWVVRCVPKGPAPLTLPGTAANAGADFVVPADCPQQIVELHAQPTGVAHQDEVWFNNAVLQ